MITDIELVSQFSVELGEDYASAKSYVRDIPTQALVFVRSFTHKLAILIAEQHHLEFNSPNLYDRIEQLNQRRLLDVTAIRTMHKLRGDGNRGAHPEKYHLTQTQLVTLAEKSIKQILNLVAKLYPVLHCTAVPVYQFVAFDSLAGRDLCYRAMMQNDHHAQYLVAMSLKAQALMAQEQASATTFDINTASALQTAQDEVQRLFAQAAYWFAQAAPFEDAALYEHGVSLLHGYAQSDQVKQGELLIAQAAKAGITDAQALLGYFYLVGSTVFTVDVEQAKALLQQAAEAENIEAMSNLGVLYYQQNDYQQALAWMSKAAESGYPQSQYHLALLLAEGVNAEADQSRLWMQEAASQGQLDAMLHCATDILHNDNAQATELELAERYLHDVIKYGHNVTAMIELSVALADGMLNRIDVVQSAYLLQQAKHYGDDIQQQVIEPLWQSLLMQIDSVIALNPSAEELASLQQAKTYLQ
ncbi:tetratricopeptide repeat protein [Shewanella subflava]|uniref:DUF4145 domain-containing protein n=1 Tax=Shewanella subflava TaxID=2986476 RepID=A0ABT3I7R6_9GAMM|nr:DUF4145 domain-containing protein [Shewanella subflava]MCW3172096.1 hypothetical protein [Shewanella subflava]